MSRALSPRVARWVPRLVLGTFGALAAAVATATPPGARPFDLEISLASTTAGTLQVFYDRGAGLSEAESITTPIRASSEPVTYRLPLPIGEYRGLRVDPNDRGGSYSFTAMRIVGTSDRTVAVIPVHDLRAEAQAQLTSSADSVTAVVQDGANDPQLMYAPLDRIRLAPFSRAWRAAAMTIGALAGLIVAFVLERLAYAGRLLRGAVSLSSPTATVVAIGFGAALVSTYPLFLGRSLVSPGNGSTAFFYDEPPFVYGSRDLVVEDTRGTDVGSMMWAILPYSIPQRDALAAGEIPLWNRYNAVGTPLWGQAQHFFFDPLHFVALVLIDPSYYADATFVAGRVVFAVGIGLATLVASGSTLAAAFAAAAAPFIGYFSFRFNHPAYFSIVYAPWILWAYFRLTSRDLPKPLVLGGAVVSIASLLQLFGSTPKEGVVAFLVAQATGMTALLLARGSMRLRVTRVATAIAAVIVAVVVATPHWLIFLDTLATSYTAYGRPSVTYAGSHEIAGLALATWLPGMPYPSLNGLVAIFAVASCCAVATIRDREPVVACAIGGGATLAVACGIVPASVMLQVPLLANLHHTWNAFISAALTPLLVAAGAALVVLQRSPRAGLVGAAIGTAVFAAATLLGIQPDRPLPVTFALASLLPGFSLAILLVLWRAHGAIGTAAAAIIVLACGLLPGGLHFETGVLSLDSTLFQPRPRADLDEPPPSVAAVRARAGSDPFRVAALDDVLFQGVQGVYRLEGLGGPDALELIEPRELSDAAGIVRTDWDWRTLLHKPDLDDARGFLDMLGVRFVFAHAEQLTSALPLNLPDPVHVIERPTAWPRAFFVDGVRRHGSLDEFMSALRASQAPFASIDRSDTAALGAVGNIPDRERVVVPAHNYRLTANRTSFVVAAPGAGVAVLAESFVARDFVATLNGERVSYFRINHALKGIVLPGAGSWSIEFEYRPRFWRLALAISIVSAMSVAAAVAFVSLRGSRREAG